MADPTERFRRIKASVQAGKDYYSEMSPNERELFFMIMQTPSMLLVPTGLISRLPAYNVAISNVPGIRQPMYWNGARMNGSYPLSIVMDGMALNITLVTYDQNVDFGIIACRRSLPLVQRLIDYMEEALQELEDAAGIKTKVAKKRPASKRKSSSESKAKASPKRKAKASPKAKTKAKASAGKTRGRSAKQKQ